MTKLFSFMIAGALLGAPMVASADTPKAETKAGEKEKAPAQKAADKANEKDAKAGEKEKAPAQKAADKENKKEAAEKKKGDKEESPAQKAAEKKADAKK